MFEMWSCAATFSCTLVTGPRTAHKTTETGKQLPLLLLFFLVYAHYTKQQSARVQSKLWHHRFPNALFCFYTRINRNQVLQKSALLEGVCKNLYISELKCRLHLDERPKHRGKWSFSKIISISMDNILGWPLKQRSSTLCYNSYSNER